MRPRRRPAGARVISRIITNCARICMRLRPARPGAQSICQGAHLSTLTDAHSAARKRTEVMRKACRHHMRMVFDRRALAGRPICSKLPRGHPEARAGKVIRVHSRAVCLRCNPCRCVPLHCAGAVRGGCACERTSAEQLSPRRCARNSCMPCPLGALL